jgi:hypothetical protein
LVTPGATESANVLAEVLKAADLDFYCLSRQQIPWTNAAPVAQAILDKLKKA